MILVFATESMTADDMVIALAVVLSLAILVALSLSAVRKYAGRFRHR